MKYLKLAIGIISCLQSRTALAQSSSCTTIPISYFTQKLDHSSAASTLTFQQRYQLDTSRFKPGGPILFYQGAESEDFFCMEAHHFNDMAAELGAILLGIEHRFFGLSYPAGVSADNATTEDFKPLTMENVVADAVDLIKWVKQNVTGASESRVIVNGGSYGGSLATIERLMYPDVFYASWPSAPLLRSFGPDLDANDDKYNWFDLIANVYQDTSAEASANISTALYELVECALPNADCSVLLKSLNLCDSGPSNATEWYTLYTDILDSYWTASQFSYSYAGVWPVANVLDVVINETLLANDSGSVLRIPAMLKNWDLNSSQCLDWQSANLTGTANTGIQVRPWVYAQCAYFPGWANSIRDGSMFPPQNQNGTIELCSVPEWQGPLYNYTNQQWIEHYNLTAEKIEATGRFLFTNDGYDPTTSVGPPPLQSNASINASRMILMPGLAHTEETYGYSLEPRGLNVYNDRLRDMVTEHIKGWLAEP